jgi:hypothetical protein
VNREAFENTDDMAVYLLQVGDGAVDGCDHGRVEELALPPGEVSTSAMQRFLSACGVEQGEALATMGTARELARSEDSGVLLRIEIDRPSPVEISRLESASIRAAS